MRSQSLLRVPGAYGIRSLRGVVWVAFTPSMGRNPCCSGPTPSTEKIKNAIKGWQQVAIPVVVDLLLRLKNVAL